MCGRDAQIDYHQPSFHRSPYLPESACVAPIGRVGRRTSRPRPQGDRARQRLPTHVLQTGPTSWVDPLPLIGGIRAQASDGDQGRGSGLPQTLLTATHRTSRDAHATLEPRAGQAPDLLHDVVMSKSRTQGQHDIEECGRSNRSRCRRQTPRGRDHGGELRSSHRRRRSHLTSGLPGAGRRIAKREPLVQEAAARFALVCLWSRDRSSSRRARNAPRRLEG